MDSLKLKWLSKEVADYEKFYNFINEIVFCEVDYIASVSYSL